MEDGVHVHGDARHASLMQLKNGLSVGCTSADLQEEVLGEGVWWLARLKIEPAHQGNKLGGQLLERLKEEVGKKEGFKLLVVDPGGYGSDLGRLHKFYESHGFVKDHRGLYCWRNNGTKVAGTEGG